jgi:hypothetical protein
LLLTASTSRDGRAWVRGGTWTLPRGADPQVGLISAGGQDPAAEIGFEYLRWYRP